MQKRLSFCLGVYNEEEVVLKGLQKIENGLEKIMGKGNFEILVIENGSTDKTYDLIRKIKKKNIRVFRSPRKGLGLALKMAIEKSRYDLIEINAIDLAFGWNDLKKALKLIDKYDIIFGSKAHPDSKVKRDGLRTISSRFYQLLLRIFFELKIKDPQGSIFLKKSKAKNFLKFCDAEDAFFSTQIAIYAQMFGLKLCEIPVQLCGLKRRSKFIIIKDGFGMLETLIAEFPKYKSIQRSLKN